MSTTATKTANLFTATVKATGPKKADKKLFKAPELGDKIGKLMALKATIEASTAELKMIEGDVKGIGRTLFMGEYLTQKRTPENFIIQDEKGATCQFVVMDKYTIVDETKAAMLDAAGVSDLLEEKIEYKFNADLVAKYGGILSQLIIDCPDISEEDKGNLISGEKSFSIKKGSIDRLLQYENPAGVFEIINPITMIRK